MCWEGSFKSYLGMKHICSSDLKLLTNHLQIFCNITCTLFHLTPFLGIPRFEIPPIGDLLLICQKITLPDHKLLNLMKQ